MISHTINQKSEEELDALWIALCEKDCAPAEKYPACADCGSDICTQDHYPVSCSCC
jgi:hypothetical protein